MDDFFDLDGILDIARIFAVGAVAVTASAVLLKAVSGGVKIGLDAAEKKLSIGKDSSSEKAPEISGK
ncbi:MAG: hypothetical protein MJ185_02760 [Treponema sp.]|nr:hypothetical protein [Treponema sp.]